jgi:hypothetical protein
MIGSVLFLLLWPVSAPGLDRKTDTNIVVGPNIHISKALEHLSHGETYIAVDPNNSRRLLGVSMVFSEEMNKTYSLVYASQDGGEHWTPTQEIKGFAHAADPVCTFGPDGTAYFVAIGIGKDARDSGDLVFYRSKDGGLTWLGPTIIFSAFQGADREYLVADHTHGPYRGRIYINGLSWVHHLGGPHRASAIGVWRSLDNGESFSEPVKMASWGSRYMNGIGNGVVLSDGTFICLFAELRDYWQPDGSRKVPENTPGRPNAELFVITSSDGGQSLARPTKVSDWYKGDSFYDKSISDIPYLAVDQSGGPFADRLYAVWPDERSGRAEILLSYSPDRGKNWSEPLVVNDDHTAKGLSGGPDHLHPQVAVNNDGVVGVTWYDRRDNPEDLGYWVRFAASLDGGETFLPSVRVSEAPMSHSEKEKWIVHGFSFPAASPVSNGLNLMLVLDNWHYHAGDTVGLAADAEGVFHPIWIDNRTGIHQVWTAPIKVNAKARPHGSPELANLPDVTEYLELVLANVRYDRQHDIVSVDVRLKNISEKTVLGPLKMRVMKILSELGNPQILNAENGEKGPGAVIAFEAVPKLNPQEVSTAKRLEFQLSHLRPIRRGKADFKFGIIDLSARIYAAKGEDH